MERAPRFEIPERLSSKTPSPDRSRALSPGKRLRDLKDDLQTMKAKNKKKKLHLKASYDADYWTARTDIADGNLKQTQLYRKVSQMELNISPDEFTKTEKGKHLDLSEHTFKLEATLCRQQLEKMRNTSAEFTIRQSYVTHFVGDGWGITHSRGDRDPEDQTNFRDDLEKKMQSKHPDPLKSLFWCPVTAMYWIHRGTTAGHLFPWKGGEMSMDAIFGRIRDEDGKSELFKAENGILWCTDAEDRFSKQFTIVPNVPDKPSEEDIERWQDAEVKDYKVKVLNHDDETMQMKIGDTDTTWADLDNRKLVFKTTFRPRARYLYFCYCEAMLRRSFGGKHKEVSKEELRKRFWGTPGKWMLRSMLLGFVENLGHDYDHLLQGAKDEEDAVSSVEAIATANERIKESCKDPESTEFDDDDEDEDQSE